MTNSYQQHKDRVARREKEKSASGRNIGEIPPIARPELREATQYNLRLHCETYYPDLFHLAWSQDQLDVISKIEQATLNGGLFAMAMPRASGKTTICECACIWAALNGHHDFIALIGASETHAAEMLESIKTEIESNELLMADYPEVCLPIEALDGIANRCNGQLHNGKRTHIHWGRDCIVLPTIHASEGTPARKNGLSLASGAIIKVAGITGRIRGMKHKRVDGHSARPSLVIVDDPQTDESAKSVSQCDQRERVLAGAILGLAGPGKKISGVMPCTVIRPGDMADRILDSDAYPQWQGRRTKLVRRFPTNTKLWDEYFATRAEGLRNGDDGKAGNQFYALRQKELEEGAEISWPARFNHDELSAVQHAMNLKQDRGESAFWAEFQNEPIPDAEETRHLLSLDDIVLRGNGLDRGVVPLYCQHVTAMVDVQHTVLYYVVTGWGEDGTSAVIDYGTFPDQQRWYFTLRDAVNTLALEFPGTGLEGSIYAGLQRLTDMIIGEHMLREDGAHMRVERCMIDANDGALTDTIYQFCRESKHAACLLPSHGKAISASGAPMQLWSAKPGDRVGPNWRIPAILGKRAIRHVMHETNFWKTFTSTRLSTPIGDPGAMSLFGSRPERHRQFAEHCTAEFSIKTQGRGRKLDEWKKLPGRDNHWFDCLVGTAVAASIQGVRVLEEKVEPPKVISLKQLQQDRRRR